MSARSLSAGDLFPDLPATALDQLEGVLERFEDAWRAGGRPALEDYLTGSGAERRALLVELVHADLHYRLRAGEAARVESYLERYPELQDDPRVLRDLLTAEYRLRRERQPALSAALPDPDPQATLAQGPTAGRSAGRPTAPGQRFHVLRPHAKGGLGEVYVALDGELHREVALKEIQRAHAGDPESRARFVLEAQVTGGLEHPGVVPVYGLGTYADGRPYYAMRFVRGDSLKDAIERFHGADGAGRDPGERGLALRQLLGRFVAVCNAVAYAHSRGVLHRDLKPGNVMLGPYGETLVVDWGLAKVIGRPDGAADSSEAALRPPSGGDSAPTELGRVVGTPAYMSPEQAEGRPDQLGPASDVYGLGATLYCLLTGRPPFDGAGAADVLRRVRQEAPAPPRQVKPAVPRALEAVCLKALARDPAQRYRTAQELADDVERWLADEPVRAWREPLARRAGRWLRRHKAVVSAAVALLVAAVVGLSVGVIVVRREQAETAHQRDVAGQQRDKARARFTQALTAVDQLHTRVSQERLLNVPRLKALRRSLLQTAVDYYEAFADDARDDPDIQAELGRAYGRLADITRETVSQRKAIEFQDRALAVFAQLRASHPDVADYELGWAEAQNALGELWLAVGETARAEAAHEQALEAGERLRRADAANPAYLQSVARGHEGLGRAYLATERDALAGPHWDESLTIRQQLAREHPDSPLYQFQLGEAHSNLGAFHYKGGRGVKARLEWQKALAVFQALADAHPADAGYRAALARTHHSLGSLFSPKRTVEEQKAQEDHYRQARSQFEELVKSYPEDAEYLSALAASCNGLAILYFYGANQRLDEAEAEYKRAADARKALADSQPEVIDYQVKLAGSYCNLGNFLSDTGRPRESLAWYDLALKTCQEALRKEPRYRTGLDYQNKMYMGRAEAYEALGRDAEALADWERVLERTDDYMRTWERLHHARMLARLGRHAEAAREAVEYAGRADTAASNLYGFAGVYGLALAAALRDENLPSADRERAADEYARQALQLLRRLQANGYFKDPARAARLDEDKDLGALRRRAEFERFREEVRENAGGRKAPG